MQSKVGWIVILRKNIQKNNNHYDTIQPQKKQKTDHPSHQNDVPLSLPPPLIDF